MSLSEAATLFDTTWGRLFLTALVSMAPVVELRGGIPFGVTLGLTPWQALAAGVAGNLVPAPFIIVYIRRIFQWMRERFPKLGRFVDRLEKKAHFRSAAVTKYKYWGLFILVAVPLPGTGAWTGALVAAFLDMRLRKAVPAILFGVLTAGFIMTFLTHTVTTALM